MSGRVADWSEWSERQLAAILLLSFAMPVHERYLCRRLKVHANTVTSLILKGLARREFYEDRFKVAGIPFITLTRYGDAVRNDYVNWHKRIGSKIGSLPPTMAAVARARK